MNFHRGFGMIPQTKKIVILGTTGSGKTTFLKLFSKDFDLTAEAKRNVILEEAQMHNTFTPVKGTEFENSTTTTSMNTQSVLFYISQSNQFNFISDHIAKSIENNADIDEAWPIFMVDTAGQERFSFMQDILIKGAHAIVIFADGTNIQSIERVSHYIRLTRDEERRKGKHIHIIVFVNKKDLQKKGYYVGSEFLSNILPEEDKRNVDIFETSIHDLESFMIPFRVLLDKFSDLPIQRTKLLARVMV